MAQIPDAIMKKFTDQIMEQVAKVQVPVPELSVPKIEVDLPDPEKVQKELEEKALQTKLEAMTPEERKKWEKKNKNKVDKAKQQAIDKEKKAKEKAEKAAKEAEEEAKKAAEEAKKAADKARKEFMSAPTKIRQEIEADIKQIGGNLSSIFTQTTQFVSSFPMLIPQATGSCALGPTFQPITIVKGLKDMMTMASALASLIDSTVSIINKYSEYTDKCPSVKQVFTTIQTVTTAAAAACAMVGVTCDSVAAKTQEVSLKVKLTKHKASKCANYEGSATKKKLRSASTCKLYTFNTDYENFEGVTNKVPDCTLCKYYNTSKDKTIINGIIEDYEEPDEDDD